MQDFSHDENWANQMDASPAFSAPTSLNGVVGSAGVRLSVNLKFGGKSHQGYTSPFTPAARILGENVDFAQSQSAGQYSFNGYQGISIGQLREFGGQDDSGVRSLGVDGATNCFNEDFLRPFEKPFGAISLPIQSNIMGSSMSYVNRVNSYSGPRGEGFHDQFLLDPLSFGVNDNMILPFSGVDNYASFVPQPEQSMQTGRGPVACYDPAATLFATSGPEGLQVQFVPGRPFSSLNGNAALPSLGVNPYTSPIADPVQVLQTAAAPAQEQVHVPCSELGCIVTFKRDKDRIRHEAAVHGNNQGVHLCHVPGCNKSQGKGYSRKDKLTEHLWKQHGNLGYVKRV